MSSRLTREESQEQTRQRLVAAASVIFREQGFHRASAETIAARAGYTRGALYANFAGKERLFLAVLDQEITERYRILTTDAPAATLAKRYCSLLDETPIGHSRCSSSASTPRDIPSSRQSYRHATSGSEP